MIFKKVKELEFAIKNLNNRLDILENAFYEEKKKNLIHEYEKKYNIEINLEGYGRGYCVKNKKNNTITHLYIDLTIGQKHIYESLVENEDKIKVFLYDYG